MSEPPITVRAKNDSGPGNITPTRVVIHTTSPVVGYPKASQAGMAASTARYFASGATIGSAHYVVDVAGEQHCVPDAVVANHAPPNGHSIGIEICAEGGTGYPKAGPQSYTREQWLSPQVWPAVLNAATRTRELCQRFGIPMVRLSVQDLLLGKHGICGHVDVAQAWHQSTHSDPGPGFPWPEFMQAVNSPTPAAPTTPTPPQQHGEDAMFVTCKLDPNKPDVAWALLAGDMFIGIVGDEIASAQEQIARGAIVWRASPASWAELDKRSHGVCDSPHAVVVTNTKS